MQSLKTLWDGAWEGCVAAEEGRCSGWVVLEEAAMGETACASVMKVTDGRTDRRRGAREQSSAIEAPADRVKLVRRGENGNRGGGE